MLCSLSGQAQHPLSFGLGYSQALELGGGGINARAYYNVNHAICFGPEVGFFFRQQEDENDHRVFKQLTEINLNGHYVVEVKPGLGVYPVAGGNLSWETEGDAEKEHVERLLGVNIGAGFHYLHNTLGVLAEYKYSWFPESSEQILTTGVFILIHPGGKNDHETEH